jgi:copper homeostasis protein
MVRPRAGDFRFSRREQIVMLRDAELLLAHEADGLACGALDAHGEIDLAFWSEFVQIAGDRETVYHRAFDELQNQPRALKSLIELGTTRVLTSGGAATASAGAEQLAKLVSQAAGRIVILPAAGISAKDITLLVHSTGCCEVHGSFRDQQSPWLRTSSQRVAAARAVLDSI